MEALQLPQEGTAQPQPDTFELWQHEADDMLFRHLGRKTIEHYIAMNGQYLGQLHLEFSGDGQIAHIDGIYPEGDIESSLSLSQWDVLVTHLQKSGITRVRKTEYPGGQSLFFEVV